MNFVLSKPMIDTEKHARNCWQKQQFDGYGIIQSVTTNMEEK